MTRDILAHSRPTASLASREKFSPSPRNLAISAAFVAGGVVTGAIGWSGHALALPIGVAFPALWAFAPSRTVAALVAAAYFLGASRGLPVGTSIFYGQQLAIGISFWLAASILFVIVHAVLWTSKGGWRRPLRYAVAAFLMSVPPFGITGWASPITAAGILFPGWGWYGLAVMAAGLVIMTTKYWPTAALVLGGFYAWSATSWTAPTVPDGWAGINTQFRFTTAGQYADYAQHLETIGMVRQAAAQGASVVVLPESAFGLWSRTTESLWRRELTGLDLRVVGGAAVVDPTGYDNTMMELTPNASQVLYRQRMPVPVSMWQPWATGGAHAQIFGNPYVMVGGKRAAPLICYELLLVWPVLQSMMYEPDMIVAVGNGWWTGGSNIVSILKASGEAWASLFDIPLIMAFNE
ncbi:conjugal transfer protein TraB [Agrobacterium tumefaciens]|uniref:Conjugal transfer protein TraB n=1 Tax=Agrobacterium tumefaciens TaxID=358 RepID=A0AA44FBG2_AGRTU|nr:conjugal transfer protein TraB [Agrobacterium tumefaciens]NTC32108.1 conjugal transfer protein TraB [Agrobacterium tumefaciens]